MELNLDLPTDPMERFKEIYEVLWGARTVFSGDSPAALRFAAVTAVTCPGEPEEVAAGIRDKAEEIKQGVSWFANLRSPLRFIISALLLLHDDEVTEFLAEVERVGKLFREKKLRRGAIYETIAVLLFRIGRDLKPVDEELVVRFKSVYEAMKKYHWWLTGPDDFPACALLALQPESPREIGETVERIYQALCAQKFRRCNPLQTAANMLYLARLEPKEAATRFGLLAAEMRKGGIRVHAYDYDKLAALSFLNHPPGRIVEKILALHAETKELRPKPPAHLCLSLATSIAFLELVQRDQDLEIISDARALVNMQQVIQAQQACAAAAASSAAASSAAASSS